MTENQTAPERGAAVVEENREGLAGQSPDTSPSPETQDTFQPDQDAGFPWDLVCVAEQLPIACYEGAYGHVIVKQAGGDYGQDQTIFLLPDNVLDLARALLKQIGLDLGEPGRLVKHKPLSPAEKQKRYRERKRGNANGNADGNANLLHFDGED